MEKEYYPGEKEIKEWIKELEGELKDKTSPFYQPSVELLEKELEKINFRIGHLSLLQEQVKSQRIGIDREKMVVQIGGEIKKLEKKKQDKQDQIEKKDIEIKYREFKLRYLEKIINQMV